MKLYFYIISLLLYFSIPYCEISGFFYNPVQEKPISEVQEIHFCKDKNFGYGLERELISYMVISNKTMISTLGDILSKSFIPAPYISSIPTPLSYQVYVGDLEKNLFVVCVYANPMGHSIVVKTYDKWVRNENVFILNDELSTKNEIQNIEYFKQILDLTKTNNMIGFLGYDRFLKRQKQIYLERHIKHLETEDDIIIPLNHAYNYPFLESLEEIIEHGNKIYDPKGVRVGF